MAEHGRAGGKKTGGRKAGVPNRATAALKDAILNAFTTVGGEAYLVTIAKTDPKTFAMLLSRVLPLTVSGDPNAPIKHEHGVSWMTQDQAKARGWV